MSLNVELVTDCKCDECGSFLEVEDYIFCVKCYDNLKEENQKLQQQISDLENEIKELKNENNN